MLLHRMVMYMSRIVIYIYRNYNKIKSTLKTHFGNLLKQHLNLNLEFNLFLIVFHDFP